MLRVNSFRQGKVASYYVYPRGGSSGFPDLMAMRGGRYVLIEVKRPTVKRLVGTQRDFARLAEHYLLPLIIASSVEDVKSWIHK